MLMLREMFMWSAFLGREKTKSRIAYGGGKRAAVTILKAASVPARSERAKSGNNARRENKEKETRKENGEAGVSRPVRQ